MICDEDCHHSYRWKTQNNFFCPLQFHHATWTNWIWFRIRAAICTPPTLVALRSVLQVFGYPYSVSVPFYHFSAFFGPKMQVMHHASCLPIAVTGGKRPCPCVYSVCVRRNSANIYSYLRIIWANNGSKYHNSDQWLRRATEEIAEGALIFIRTTNGEVGGPLSLKLYSGFCYVPTFIATYHLPYLSLWSCLG
jgi:hypothetical protein